MHEEKTNLLIQRVKQFHTRLANLIIEDSVTMKALFCPSKDPVPFKARLRGKYHPINESAEWGKTWESAWFKLSASIPSGWKGKAVAANLDFNGEGLVYLPDGSIVQGITNGSVFNENFARDIVRLYPSCKGGEKVKLWVEVAANGLLGVNKEQDPPAKSPKRYGHYLGKVNKMRICVFNEEMWHFRLDVEVLRNLMEYLPKDSVRHARILRCLGKAEETFADNPRNVRKCRALLKKELDQPACASDLRVTAVGHAHIDTGWLWRVRETIRKTARTFSNQVRLIERYPEYVFGASQAQLYMFIKEHYPDLYARIRRLVKAGRWEVQGGMWVEADCNIIGGESMVRQFLHGKNFFKDEFGVDVRNLWLPDVFGYSAAMPQILKKCGCDFFVTQKISWSQFNTFPHHTFKWRGIDGSEVITHFPPENTYNSLLKPRSLLEGQHRFREKDFISGYLSLFGVGDGGGGPREEEIERGLRQKNLEGSPKVVFGAAQGFLDSLNQIKDKLETWVGELYLEVHRATLTSQAKVKRGNRKLEYRLRQLEFLCSCLPLNRYPQDDLDAIWKMLLRNQFHDIIPGSSIPEVYQDTLPEYADAMATCARLEEDAAAKLFKKDKNSAVLVNSLSCPFTDPVVLPESWKDCSVHDRDGNPLPVQDEDGRTVVLAQVPPLSAVTLTKDKTSVNRTKIGKGLILENDLVRYELDNTGVLIRALDKDANREVLPKGGKGNVLSLYEDRPHNSSWDAWDIDFTYENQRLETAECLSAKRLAGGPVRERIRFTGIIGRSKIAQEVALAMNSKRLDFYTSVDWAEKHRMLRVSFPVNLKTDHASFDIQYGYINRPNHRNTSWDMAKFEVAAHRYVDLSNPDYGVALLNDCKYGHKVYDNILDLNLLRAPTYPDPDTDRGKHEFVYSLLPHNGDLVKSDVIHHAMCLNQGMMVFDGYQAGGFTIPVRLEGVGLALEVLKKAEKEKCLIIRVVETLGCRSFGTLTVTEPTASLVETNLMEWINGPEIKCRKPFDINLSPFEIRTYKLKR